MISIVIPLYNKGTIIERTVRSVITQHYVDYEIIVVNDGSTDKGADIVRSMNDSRIQLIEQNNGGPSKARNTGMKHAKGEWIVFLDADDELTEDALQTMIDEVNKYPDADIIDFNRIINNGKSMILQQHPLVGKVCNPLKSWFYNKIAPGCGHSIYKTSFIKQYPYNEALRRYEDADLLFRILPVGKVYSSSKTTEIHNISYAQASHPRKNIMEDLIGHLNMGRGSFWYRMNMYKFFLFERDNYPAECKRLYSSWYKRYDMLALLKFLSLLNI